MSRLTQTLWSSRRDHSFEDNDLIEIAQPRPTVDLYPILKRKHRLPTRFLGAVRRQLDAKCDTFRWR